MKQKKPKQETLELKNLGVFNPEHVRKTVEIPVKPKPTIEEIETIEKVGTAIEKKQSISKSRKTLKIKSKSTFKKSPIAIKSPSEFKEKKLIKDGYVLVITEKPQAAAKIAAALSEGREIKRSDNGIPYYELERNGREIRVACAVGHLFTVSQIKKGTDYPIFDIAWFPNYEIKKKDFTKKYFQLIKRLVTGASEIVVATDFDTEGEVIGYNIIRFIAGQKDAKRMKFSSLTAKEIQDSFEDRHPTIEWGQAIAGETRHFIDWLYGINLSRALMNAIKSTGKFKIMSIGRVQGPALNLIVEKEKEILNFKSSPYWQIFIKINDGKNTTELKYIKDITKKQDLDKFKDLVGKKAIAQTIKTKQSIEPPSPFDLTTLQTESYKFHGITPSQTLRVAQKLYLAGLISYPRTSSQKIPETIEPKRILKQLEKHYGELVNNVARDKPVEGKKSDPAHPAITPTGIYNKLEGEDKKIYELIVKRFISCFCSNAELENKRVELEINGLKFSEKGMEILSQGWMEVYPSKIEEKEIKDFNGEVLIEKLNILEKMTQPPKRYSPASIISELERKNLGTKATRSNIIDTLYDRDYIKEKSIQATELGISLIDSLKKNSPIIIDEKLTREIEKDMEIIRSSKKDLEKKQANIIKIAEDALKRISDEFKKNEHIIGKELMIANNNIWEKEKENNKLGIKCPNCKEGELSIKFSPRFRSYFIACSSYPDCKQTYPLPSNSLIKKSGKICEYCNYPMLLSIKKGKKPWLFCFNKDCKSRQQKDNLNNNNISV
ncbi:MAG: DNA topoisomerase I [Nanoarchaeota archaeon]|nr:DNA topoisomerase I [Nanoarchaeota archaeon]